MRSLDAAFLSPSLPTEVLQVLLNLAEFMEHDDKPLPVDIRTLGALADRCRAYAKVTLILTLTITLTLNPNSNPNPKPLPRVRQGAPLQGD